MRRPLARGIAVEGRLWTAALWQSLFPLLALSVLLVYLSLSRPAPPETRKGLVFLVLLFMTCLKFGLCAWSFNCTVSRNQSEIRYPRALGIERRHRSVYGGPGTGMRRRATSTPDAGMWVLREPYSRRKKRRNLCRFAVMFPLQKNAFPLWKTPGGALQASG